MKKLTPDNEYCVNIDYSQEWHDKATREIKRKYHLQNMIVKHVVDNCDIDDFSQKAHAWEMVAELGKLVRDFD